MCEERRPVQLSLHAGAGGWHVLVISCPGSCSCAAAAMRLCSHCAHLTALYASQTSAPSPWLYLHCFGTNPTSYRAHAVWHLQDPVQLLRRPMPCTRALWCSTSHRYSQAPVHSTHLLYYITLHYITLHHKHSRFMCACVHVPKLSPLACANLCVACGHLFHLFCCVCLLSGRCPWFCRHFRNY